MPQIFVVTDAPDVAAETGVAGLLSTYLRVSLFDS